MTPDDLRKAEAHYQRASRRAEAEREARNAAVREALAEGWTHAAISGATGLSRGRIGQIATATLESALSAAETREAPGDDRKKAKR